MKKAIIFGASGLIGSHLLIELLNNAAYKQVTVVVRKPLDIVHPKLKMLIGDYHSLPRLKGDIVADEVFITLGTTKKNTPDQNTYYQVDHDYPVLAATLARENGARTVLLVTAVGANANASIFYVKTKGQTEQDIIALNFDYTHIFRPSVLLGNRKEHRPLEKVLVKILPVINPILTGRLRKYRAIDAKEVAVAMVNAANIKNSKMNLYHWKEMKELL